MPVKVNLNKILKKQNLSLDELADRSGISKTELSILNDVKFTDRRFYLLQRICNELGCKLSDILNFDTIKE